MSDLSLIVPTTIAPSTHGLARNDLKLVEWSSTSLEIIEYPEKVRGRLEANPSWTSSILRTSKLQCRSRVIAEATVAFERTVFDGAISSEAINTDRLAILADGIKTDYYYSVLSLKNWNRLDISQHEARIIIWNEK
jgi:hypothetical protein